MTEIEKLIARLKDLRHSLVNDFRLDDATTVQLAIDLIESECDY